MFTNFLHMEIWKTYEVHIIILDPNYVAGTLAHGYSYLMIWSLHDWQVLACQRGMNTHSALPSQHI